MTTQCAHDMPTEPRALITAEVVRQLSPYLRALAWRRVRNQQDAEDLVQETWCCALRSAPSFEGRSSLVSWLAGILRRRAAERLRRDRAAECFDDESFVPPPSEALERIDLELAVRLAICAFGSLSAPERLAFKLCDVQELDRDDACEVLGVTRGHLRVLLHRGRQKLGEYADAQLRNPPRLHRPARAGARPMVERSS